MEQSTGPLRVRDHQCSIDAMGVVAPASRDLMIVVR